MASNTIEQRIRWAGLLVVTGILVQLLTMSWAHPLAFMAFLMIGCPITLAGILLSTFSRSRRRDRFGEFGICHYHSSFVIYGRRLLFPSINDN